MYSFRLNSGIRLPQNKHGHFIVYHVTKYSTILFGSLVHRPLRPHRRFESREGPGDEIVPVHQRRAEREPQARETRATRVRKMKEIPCLFLSVGRPIRFSALFDIHAIIAPSHFSMVTRGIPCLQASHSSMVTRGIPRLQASHS